MDAHKYELIVFRSAEDEAFVVDVPELPGCIAHGATPAEAVASAQEAIALWLEVAREDGRPVPAPKGAPAPVRVARTGHPCAQATEALPPTRRLARQLSP